MKKMLLICLFSFHIIICLNYNGFAQKYSPKYLRENDKTLLALTSKATANGWLEFQRDKDAENVDPDSFFERFGKNLGLGEGYHMKSTQDETDFRQIRHQRFQLYYKNIRVEGVEYSLHSRLKRLEVAHGRIAENLVLDVDKPIPEQRALELALADQKLSLDDIHGKDLPKGELIIARLDDEAISQNYRLCYIFDVQDDGLSTRKEVYPEPQRIYVDAVSGQVVQRTRLAHTDFGPISPSTHSINLTLRETEKMEGPKIISRFFVPSTFIPNRSRYLNAQGGLGFETEQVTVTTPGGTSIQYRLALPGTSLNTRIGGSNPYGLEPPICS